MICQLLLSWLGRLYFATVLDQDGLSTTDARITSCVLPLLTHVSIGRV